MLMLLTQKPHFKSHWHNAFVGFISALYLKLFSWLLVTFLVCVLPYELVLSPLVVFKMKYFKAQFWDPSIYILFFGDLTQLIDLKYHLKADDSPKFLSPSCLLSDSCFYFLDIST